MNPACHLNTEFYFPKLIQFVELFNIYNGKIEKRPNYGIFTHYGKDGILA